MVHTYGGQVDQETTLQNLRVLLQGISDPQIRASILQDLADLEAKNNPVETSRKQNPRTSILESLNSAGITNKPLKDDRTKQALQMTENALQVLTHRYLLKDKDRNVIETPEQLFRRVAKTIAGSERIHGANDEAIQKLEETFYGMMTRLEFLPNSPTLMNAGTEAGTLSACFVLPLEDTLESIMRTATDIAMVQKYGGGTGVPLSGIRQKGSHIATTHGRACGPIAVLRHLSSVSTMITQGGKRDGANMAVMDIHHPDIEEFINCKQQEGQIHNYNISVGATDEFMESVLNGGTLESRDPKTGEITNTQDAGGMFQQIIEGAWRNGEPGMIFMDQVNRNHPTPNLGEMQATNPCGEQPLLPYESCNLGSINMARMLRFESDLVEIDWDKLRETAHLAIRFLDDIIDCNHYSVDEIQRMNEQSRKVGLGVMGFADMLVRLGVPYNSEEGVKTGRKVMQFISKEARVESERLAEERGPFGAWEGSRPQLIGAKPLRNACQLTVAPTGTISMIAGCSSGIEPLFALAYRKHNILEGQTLYYVDEAFEAVARHEGFYSNDLMEELAQGNSLRNIELGQNQDVPTWARELFATAPDIAPEWHVRMQAAFQESTDAAISKTINFPNDATIEDVRKAYLQAWESGCKGITVYRAGSREQEVLTAGTKPSQNVSTPESSSAQQLRMTQPPLGQSSGGLIPRQRPRAVQGITERIRTGHGNIYVTINFDEAGRPFEVFTALGKAGSSDSAQLEAVARLTSMALRAGVDPEEVITQLRGITDEPTWDQGILVRSAPDALAHALARAVGLEKPTGRDLDSVGPYSSQPSLFQRDGIRGDSGELPLKPVDGNQHKMIGEGRSGWGSCPECSGPLVYQEGCLTCRECGYNKCG
jgi:ribonucleoside-diphosphate reductase alpha chain